MRDHAVVGTDHVVAERAQTTARLSVFETSSSDAPCTVLEQVRTSRTPILLLPLGPKHTERGGGVLLAHLDPLATPLEGVLAHLQRGQVERTESAGPARSNRTSSVTQR